MAEFFQQLLNVVTLAGIYCLIASGLTLVYGVMGVPNFAQGSLYTVGAYLSFFLASIFGSNYWMIFLGAFVIMGAVGVLIEILCFRPVYDAPHINTFVVALALMMILEGSVVLIFGGDFLEVEPAWKGIVEFWQVTITKQRLLVILGSALIMVILNLFLKKTRKGMCLEAISQNKDLGFIVGINANHMSLLAFIISTGLAGLAGTLVAPVGYLFPEMGMSPLLVGFAAVIFGGLGSLAGAIIGSFVMAAAFVFSTQYITAIVSDIAIFGIMIIILIFRPTGIMGGRK